MDMIPQDTPQKQCSTCPNSYPATPQFFDKDRSKPDKLRTQCKECRKQYRLKNRERNRLYSLQYAKEHRQEKMEYDRQYAREHQEERVVYNKQHRHDNRALFNERRRKYASEHREDQRQRNRSYYHEHREAYHERKKRYWTSHKEQQHAYETQRRQKKTYQEYAQHYRDTHKELYSTHGKLYRQTEHGKLIIRAHAHRYRARKLAVPGTLTPQQIVQKLRLQRFQCYYCSTRFAKRNGKYLYHIEHTIPLSRTEASPRHDMSFTVLACPHCNQRKHNKLPHEWPDGGRLF